MPGRRQERRDDRQLGRPGSGGKRYQMRQKMAAIGSDFWVENDHGQKVFKIDGKALRVRSTFVFEDAHGVELAKIQERKLRVKDSMEIEGPKGENLATVKNWPLTVTIVDMVWGSVLATMVTTVGYFAGRWLQ